jgi:hypothetical protein
LKAAETHVQLASPIVIPTLTELLGLREQEEINISQNSSTHLGMSTVENGQQPRATNGENASTTITNAHAAEDDSSKAHATKEYSSSNSNLGGTTEEGTERAKKVSSLELEAF